MPAPPRPLASKQRSSSDTLGLSAWGLTLLLFGCVSCDDDKPYTPFEVASALPSAPPPRTPTTPSPRASAEFESVRATAAQHEAKTINALGRQLKAPADGVFQSWLAADFDGNQKQEVVAIVEERVTEDDKTHTVWLYPHEGPPRRLAKTPDFVPGGASCRHKANLERTGPGTLTLRVTARCNAKALARTPDGSIQVIQPLKGEPVLLTLRTLRDAPGEKLDYEVVSQDQDGDGQDDVVVKVTQNAGGVSKAAATAPLVWFARPSGLARDESEPGVTLARLASTEVIRSRGKKSHLTVAQSISNLRRLYSALCSESGTTRVTDTEGTPFSCGRLSVTFLRLKEAEIRSYLHNKKISEALGVLERDAWFGHPLSDREFASLLALIRPHLDDIKPKKARLLEVRVPRRGSAPRFSPLSFDTSQHLLVHAAGGHQLLFDPDGDPVQAPVIAGAELPKKPAWPLEVVASNGRVWSGVTYSCDRSEVSLRFSDPTRINALSAVTQLLAPRPGFCVTPPAFSEPEAVPLAWKGNTLLAWIAGSFAGPDLKDLEVPRGSALSSDGNWVAFSTRFGILVSGKEDELWKVPSPPGNEVKLSDCTVSVGAQRVACVQGERAVLLTR